MNHGKGGGNGTRSRDGFTPWRKALGLGAPVYTAGFGLATLIVASTVYREGTNPSQALVTRRAR